MKGTNVVEIIKSAKKQNNPEYSPKASSVISKWKEIINSQNVDESPAVVAPSSVKAEQLDTAASVLNNETNNKLKMSMSDYKVKNEKQSDQIKSEPAELPSSRLKLPTVPIVKNEPVTRKEPPNPSVPVSRPPPATSSTGQAENFVLPLPTISLDSLLNLNELNSASRKPQTATSVQQQSVHNSAYINGNSSLNVKESKKSAMLGDSDALSKIFSSKHSARMLYTGRKNIDPTNNIVQKLFDLCTRNLIESIDDFPTRVYEYSKSATHNIRRRKV